MREYRLFVSSPGDATVERQHTETIVGRLNGEFAGLARLVTIRWETEFYRAHATFQTQIPPAADCDIVIGILRWRLGTELPPDFGEHLPDGRPYPSGTAYEILSAVEKRKAGAALPDVFVFRFAESPSIKVDGSDRAHVEADWAALRAFFERWFVTPQGHFLAALNMYASEDQFERQLESLLRKWLAEKVAGGRVVPWPATKGSPFRGLSVFGARHAPVFFGRAGDIRKATDLWRSHARRGVRFLLVVGASGAGKSSLARAGLIPRLTTPGVVAEIDTWRVAVMRPGDRPEGPFVALAAALLQAEATLPAEERGRGPALPEIAEGDSQTVTDLAAVLAHADAGAARPILNALARVGARTRASGHHAREVRCDLLLLVDQLDELFAPSVSAEVRSRFADLLAMMVASGRVWVLATLRADLYAAMLEVAGLKGLKDTGAAYDLAPPGAAELAEIVREPARAAGLAFETDPTTAERLDERLLREADRPDMLPLVQLALSRLWEARETRGGETVLPFAAFQNLGGVRGIVAEAGETALAGVDDATRKGLPSLVRKLAELSHGPTRLAGSLMARAVPIAEAAPNPDAKALLAALVAARLLTLCEEGGAISVRLAHQRVLTDWPRAAEIVADSADFYRVRDEVEEQRRRWEAGKHRGELLLARGLPLAEARAMAARYAAELPTPTRAYIAASRRRANRVQMVGWVAAAVFALLAVGAGVAAKVALDQTARAERNFAAAKNTVDRLIFNIAQGLRDAAGMRVETIRTILKTAQQTVDQLLAAAPDDADLLRSRAGMFDNFATTYLRAGDVKAARDAAVESLAIDRKLAAQNPADAMAQGEVAIALQHIGDVKLRAGDTAGALLDYQESLSIFRKFGAGALRGVLVSLRLIGNAKQLIGDTAGALAAFQESLAIARSLAAQNPGKRYGYDVADALINLGDVKLYQGDTAGALAAFQESLAIRRAFAVQFPGNARYLAGVADSLDRVANMKRVTGDRIGALADHEEVLAIRRRLAALDYGDAQALSAVAAALERVGGMKWLAGDLSGALQAYAEELSIERTVAAHDPGNVEAQRNVWVSLNRVGGAKERAFEASGLLADRDGALAAFEEELAIQRRLAAVDPTNAKAQAEVATGLNDIGRLKLKAGDRVGAFAAFEEALAIERKMTTKHPEEAGYLADLLGRIGDAKLQTGDLSGAIARYQERADIARKMLGRGNPANARARRALVASLNALANAKRQAGDGAGALRDSEEGLGIWRQLAAELPRNPQTQQDLAFSLNSVGNLRLEAGDWTGALALYQEMLVLSRTIASESPTDAQAQRGVFVAYFKIGSAKLQGGDQAGALAAYEESLAVARKLVARHAGNAQARNDLILILAKLAFLKLLMGDALGALAADTEIIAMRRTLVAQNPGSAEASRDLSLILEQAARARLRTGDDAGSLSMLAESLGIAKGLLPKLDPKQAPAGLINLIARLAGGFVLARDFGRGLSTAEFALTLGPDLDAEMNRGHALMFLGRVEEARAAYLRHRGAKIPSGKIWEKGILGDFAEFRKAGLTAPLMDEIEKAFVQPPT